MDTFLLARPWAATVSKLATRLAPEPGPTPTTTRATRLAATLLLAACGQQAAPPAVPAPPAAVQVIASRAEAVPVVDEYEGRIAAYRSVEIRARVEGILEQRHFIEGSEVERGQLHHTIDSTPFKIALADAQADQARSQANLASARSREARLAPLVKEAAISQRDYDDALSAVNQTEALLAVSAANIDRAQPNLGYTGVLATENGKIAATLVPEGRLVGKGEATHLTAIDRLDQVYVNFTMAEGVLAGQRADAAAGLLRARHRSGPGRRRREQPRQAGGAAAAGRAAPQKRHLG